MCKEIIGLKESIEIICLHQVRAILVVALIPHGVDRMGKVDIMVVEGMSYGQGQIFPSSTEGQEFSREQECLMVKDRFIQALLKVKTFPI